MLGSFIILGSLMYSVFAFILTALEVGAIIAGYSLQNQPLFYNVVVYGSPFYMLQNAFGSGSMWHETNLLYWGFAVFHVIKYLMIIQSQRADESNIMRTLAMFLEAGYIALSAYYLI